MRDIPVWDGNGLGATLRNRRRSLGILQSKAAADLGFSPRLVSEIENGRETVAYGKILRYAGYLGLEVFVREK